MAGYAENIRRNENNGWQRGAAYLKARLKILAARL